MTTFFGFGWADLDIDRAYYQ